METPEPIDTSYVGKQVRQLRGELQLDLVDLSERLEPLGISLGKNALSKLETGSRKISVEELLALAVALDVTPNRLLLGGAADDDMGRNVEIARTWVLPLLEAWQWAQGERWPEPKREGSSSRIYTADIAASRAFTERNQPHKPHDSINARQYIELASQGVFDRANIVAEELEARGISPVVLIQHLEIMAMNKAMQRAAREIAEGDDGQHQDA